MTAERVSVPMLSSGSRTISVLTRVIFLFAQRYFIRSVVASGVKG
jgi:ABC-type glycerol-3-phosphate transport system permease component